MREAQATMTSPPLVARDLVIGSSSMTYWFVLRETLWAPFSTPILMLIYGSLPGKGLRTDFLLFFFSNSKSLIPISLKLFVAH